MQPLKRKKADFIVVLKWKDFEVTLNEKRFKKLYTVYYYSWEGGSSQLYPALKDPGNPRMHVDYIIMLILWLTHPRITRCLPASPLPPSRDMFSRIIWEAKEAPIVRQIDFSDFLFHLSNHLGVFLADRVSAKANFGLPANTQRINLIKKSRSLHPQRAY